LIDKVNLEVGSFAPQGTQIATLLSLDPVMVKGEVSERDLRFVKAGDKAEAKMVNGDMLHGEVRYIGRESTPATRTFRVEIAIANPDDKVPAGMTSEIVLRGETTDSVILPRSVVTLSGKGDLGVRVCRQGQQGWLCADRSRRRHGKRPGAWRRACRCASDRRRSGTGD
jgi:multidrug efflux system membrane fusion protein